MKDYYYILGIPATATPDEIKTAYRKLSTKFHPDKNGGDLFFEERFKEIHEAYDMLSRPERRANYDRAFRERSSPSGNSGGSTPPNHSNFYPTIESFTVSPSKIYDGDEVEFSWSVFNADSIQIEKIGIVPARGKKRIKISGMRGSKAISVTLSAINTHIGKSEKKSVQVFNQAYEDIEREVLENKSRDFNSSEPNLTKQPEGANRTNDREKGNSAGDIAIKVLISIVFIILLLILADMI